MGGEARRRPAGVLQTRSVEGFDFTSAIAALCIHACQEVDVLRHIRMPQVAVGFRQARKAVSHGLQASLTPMRFERGAIETIRRGKRWTTQRILAPNGQEVLYLLNFYLPRFLNLPFDEKLTTIFHELWHIGPEFDGDLRRHEGRCYVHGPRQSDFDEVARHIAQAWMAGDPPRELWVFLHDDFSDLKARYGSVYGARFAAPKLIPVDQR